MVAGLLERLVGAPSAVATGGYPPWDDFWYGAIDRAASSGIAITPEVGLGQAAVFACTRVIAEDVGSLPLPLYRRLGGRARQRISPQELPLARKLAIEPNRDQTSMEWREMMTGHAVLRGNAFSLIVPGNSGFVEELVPLNPARVEPKRRPDGTKFYRYHPPETGQMVEFTASEIFHLPGLGWDGLQGMSVVSVAREAIGTAVAAERHGGSFFRHGVTSTGALRHKGQLSPEGHQNLKESFSERQSGFWNAWKPIILEEGMEWQQLGMTMEDAQWVETRKFQAEEIARFFRMQQHKIGILEHATFSNIEHQAIQYVTETLRPWLVRWEQRISKQLIARPDILFAEFNAEGLLRGDIKSRYEAYAIARQWGWMNPDEIRANEGMNPIPDGQTYLTPLNMIPADAEHPALARLRQSSSGAQGRARLLAEEVATRLVRKELDRLSAAAKRYAGDQDGWEEWLTSFYTKHADEVSRSLCLSEEAGVEYAEAQLGVVKANGMSVAETWLADRPQELARVALEGA